MSTTVPLANAGRPLGVDSERIQASGTGLVVAVGFGDHLLGVVVREGSSNSGRTQLGSTHATNSAVVHAERTVMAAEVVLMMLVIQK